MTVPSAPKGLPVENGKILQYADEPATVGEPAANVSGVNLALIGAGGCGINLCRHFVDDYRIKHTQFFDTSKTNERAGERVHILTNGSGSGSNRAENARDIERNVPQLDDKALGNNDVAIVQFSLAGGSGSVSGPILIREYARRGHRVIGICVADTTSLVSAKNTRNTLRTLQSIAKNNELEIPLIVLSNDMGNGRGNVDKIALSLTNDLIDLLTRSVYEVDRNDRLNWISPMKVVGSNPGLRIISLFNDQRQITSKAILGADSTEMVDSLLILQNTLDERPEDSKSTIPSRLKKTGFYVKNSERLVGRVTSDISCIDAILDGVMKMENAEKAQRNSSSSRLSVDLPDGDDLVL